MPSKSEFICSICKKILLEPIEYECECTKTTRICNEHISMHCPNTNKRKKISIECVNCGEQLIETNFVKAEDLQAQIESYSYLSSCEMLLKKLLETLLDEMTLIVNETFGFIVNNEFSLVQHDHFFDLKLQVDLRRESFLENVYTRRKRILKSTLNKIHTQSQMLIESIESHENLFRSNFENHIRPRLLKLVVNDVDEAKANLVNGLRQVLSDKDDEDFNFFPILNDLLRVYQTKLKELKDAKENFLLIEYDLKRNKFVYDDREKRIHLGELKLYKDFVRNIESDAKINVFTIEKHVSAYI